MKLAIPKERHERETRVAAIPESVKKFAGLGVQVVVEQGAGRHSRITDEAFKEAGAAIESELSKVIGGADVVLKVRRPEKEELEHFKKGAVLVGMLEPHGDKENAADYARRGIDAFAMEFMPRISRAQSMDVLSSQSNLAGYKAVVDAAAHLNRAMPMMMTAAGTIPPARVFVLGAGVAGLQAVATARRLGAIVSATDVRPAVKEQVESLGANFVMVESEETKDAETKAGYAKEMSEEFKRKQAQLIADTIAKQDIVITTALIPGRPAPVLVTKEMVGRMKPGAIIVDLAVEQGGNCPLSKPDEIVEHNGVAIMGHLNLAGHLPVDASALYARNLFNFLSPFINKESGNLELDWEDAVVEGTALTRNGEVVHPSLKGETN